MEREKLYKNTRLKPDQLKLLVDSFSMDIKGDGETPRFLILKIFEDSFSSIGLDSFEDFLLEIKSRNINWSLLISNGKDSLHMSTIGNGTSFRIQAKQRFVISKFELLFNSHLDKAWSTEEPLNIDVQEEEEEEEENLKPTIFIGHGRSQEWRDLKEHLQDKHNYKVTAFETGARAGLVIRDILTEMAAESDFAIIVMTGEDLMAKSGDEPDHEIRARQNVIHELGLFQGKLGFSRAIMVVENGIKSPSNVDGIIQIRFSKGNIASTFGDILSTISREFAS